MNKIIKSTLVIGVLTILLGFGLDTTALSEAEANGGDDFAIVKLTGKPTSFVTTVIKDSLVATITAATSEGQVTITQIVSNPSEDILLGCTLGNSNTDQCAPGNPATRDGEHIVLEDKWDFGGRDILRADTRVYIDEVSVKDCGEFINNRHLAIISGGTGRFADAEGYIKMDIKPFCFGDTFTDTPPSLKGRIDGLIIVHPD